MYHTSTNNPDINELYKNMVDSIRNSSKYTLEEEDILILLSMSTEQFDQSIFNSNTPKNEFNNRKLLGNNIYTDFWKLIKTPSFISRMHLLFTEIEGDKIFKNLYDNYKKIFNSFLSGDILEIEKRKGIPVKNTDEINHYHYFNYLVINGSQINLADGTQKNNKKVYEIIPLILLSLYLECCIYLYAGIRSEVKHAYETSMKLGTMILGLNPYLSDELFKSDVFKWLNYRNIINNKLFYTSNKVIMFKQNTDKTFTKTDDILSFTHFNLSDIYSNDELIKLKHLVKYRHELQKTTTYNGNPYNKTYEEFIKDIDEFFNSKKLMLSVKQFMMNPTSLEYIIYQALHAYDQIIKELIDIRFIFFNELRNKFFDNTDEIYRNAEKMIATLQQYLNYPLTFQYKFARTLSCSHLLSEETNKVLLDKYLKMYSVFLYCKKNDIDIFNSGPVIKTTDEILKDLSIKEVFNWDKLNDPFNKRIMQKIIKNINLANIDQSKYLEAKNLSDEIKIVLKELLTDFCKNPMNDLNDHYKGIYKINIAGGNLLLDNGSDGIKDFAYQINNITKSITFNTSQVFNQPYFDVMYKSEITKINDDINKYNFGNSTLKTIIRDTNSTLNNIFIDIKKYQKFILDIRNIIDETNDTTWTITFKDKGLATINHNLSIDYNTVLEKERYINLKLSQLNNYLNNLYNKLKNNIDKFRSLFDSIKLQLKLIESLKDTINVDIQTLQNKIDSEILLNTTNIGLLNTDNLALTANNTMLTANDVVLNTKKVADTAILNTNIAKLLIDEPILNADKVNLMTDRSNLAVKKAINTSTYNASTKTLLLNEITILEANITALGPKIAAQQTIINKLKTDNSKLDLDIKKSNADIATNNIKRIANNKKIFDNQQKIIELQSKLVCSQTLRDDRKSNIDQIFNYKTVALDKSYSDLKAKIDETKINYVDSVLFSGFEFGFNNLVLRLNKEFNILKYFISILNRSHEKMLNDTNPRNYELHRIKKGIFNLTDLCYQNIECCRNATRYNGYDINHQSASLELLIPELFKNNKNIDNKYFDLAKIDQDIDTPYEPLKGINVIKSDTFYNEYSKINGKKNLYKFEDPLKINDILNIPKEYNIANYNISVFQLINYFNSDAVFNMCEKFYYYLVALGEINENLDINNLVKTLRAPFYYNAYSDEKNKRGEKYIKRDKYDLYFKGGKKDIRKLVDLFELYSTDIDYLNFLCLNIVTNNDNIKFEHLFINSNNIHNTIHLDPKIIIDKIIEFDVTKLVKYIFKRYRNENVLIDQDISNYRNIKVPFDDLNFYRHEKCLRYDVCTNECDWDPFGEEYNKEPYYLSYFSLGNISKINGKEIINFSNKINDVAVNVLEFTNGRF